jgi:2'-5' RNA ligase
MGVRTFIGIALPLPVRQALGSAQQAMRDDSPEWRTEKWVAEENLHVTLKFLGSLPEDLVTRAADTLVAASATYPRFQLHLDEIAAIPRIRSATMLWAGVGEGRDRTVELAMAIDDTLAGEGFAAETRTFRPHVTLVRSRNARRIALATLDAGNQILFASEERRKRVSVRGVTLFSSTLTPHGPVYVERCFAPLAE